MARGAQEGHVRGCQLEVGEGPAEAPVGEVGGGAGAREHDGEAGGDGEIGGLGERRDARAPGAAEADRRPREGAGELAAQALDEHLLRRGERRDRREIDPGGRARDEGDRPDAAREQIGGLERADAEDGVVRLLQDGDAARVGADLDDERGVQAEQRGEDPGQEALGEVGRSGEAQLPELGGPLPTGLGGGGVELAQHVAGALEVALPGGRGADPAAGAHQQLDADGRLQVGDLPAHGGELEAEALGGAGEGARLGGGDEGDEAVGVHSLA
jgi:hypothetical protein